MAGTAPQIEWYLARGGQQYGPLSDVEMQKFIELGHLRPTDLVWRHGFPDWRPGAAVFPELGRTRTAPATHGQAPRTSTLPGSGQPGRTGWPQHGGRAQHQSAGTSLVGHDAGAELDEPRAARRGRGRAALLVLFLIAIAGAGWLAWENREKLPGLAEALTAAPFLLEEPAELYRMSPFAAAGDTAEAIDAGLQKAALWRLLKLEFPDWYAGRVKQIEKLRAEKQDDAAIQKQVAEAIVDLRRKYAGQALASSPKSLRRIAVSFRDNLMQLAKQGTLPCFGFISFGEASPPVLDVVRDPAKSEQLHRQVTAIFEAVVDGRKSPQTHQPARKADYDVLVAELTSRGWSQTELQIFSDPRALARAPPDQVCKMVQDWIAAHLNVKDGDMQTRLLSETLRPLVQG